MAGVRKPLQGILNIVRFNWHFYVFSFILIAVLIAIGKILHLETLSWIAMLIGMQIFISLLVSLYIYDLSGFYKLEWLNGRITPGNKIVNINAGFDEISEVLYEKFPESKLIVFDFYNPLLHTEVSIKRARQIYPPYPGTIAITTSSMPFDEQADKILLVFAAHEIRASRERIDFFSMLKSKLHPGGEIILVEHLRNFPNFLAYNMGYLHFISRRVWYNIFQEANFQVTENRITPFVSIFSLKSNGS